jgi:hypothetical protein
MTTKQENGDIITDSMAKYLDLSQRGYATAWVGEGKYCMQPTKLSTLLDTVIAGVREVTFDFGGWKQEDVARVQSVVGYRGLHGAFDGRFMLVRALYECHYPQQESCDCPKCMSTFDPLPRGD